MNRLARVSLIAAVLAGSILADLAEVKSEPNPEKRARAALDNAQDVLRQSRAAYSSGERGKAIQLLTEVQESVELANTSLQETGKKPGKRPRPFKDAEQKISGILRRLRDFKGEMSLDDRASLDPVEARIQQIHEDLLLGVLEKKK